MSGVHEKPEAERTTDVTDDRWWATTAPYAAEDFDAERFPTAARVGPVAGAELPAAYDPRRTFDFGFQLLLDGVAKLVSDPGS